MRHDDAPWASRDATPPASWEPGSSASGGPWPSSGPPRPEDFSRPSSARVYDFMLGGAVNGEVDREMGRELIRLDPITVAMARENRSFLRRTITFLARRGIDQFLDLGSGIPSMGNVHEVARRCEPAARVAYVDVDSVAVGHGRALLEGEEGLSFTAADLRDPDAVLAAPGVRDVLDLDRPVALCLFSVLQHVPDGDDPAAIVRRYLRALAPGSALALSHVTADDPRIDVAGVRRLTGAYSRGAVIPRSRAEVIPMLRDVDLVDPGLVWSALWRPDDMRPDLACGHHGAVGLRP